MAETILTSENVKKIREEFGLSMIEAKHVLDFVQTNIDIEEHNTEVERLLKEGETKEILNFLLTNFKKKGISSKNLHSYNSVIINYIKTNMVNSE